MGMQEKRGILCDQLGVHIGPSPVGTKLEVEAKMREAVGYCSSLERLGLTVMPQVVSQRSFGTGSGHCLFVHSASQF